MFKIGCSLQYILLRMINAQLKKPEGNSVMLHLRVIIIINVTGQYSTGQFLPDITPGKYPFGVLPPGTVSPRD